MDTVKLIERLKNNQHPNGLKAQAATAISTLQAEIVKLRAELERAQAEITRLKHYEDKCHDCPVVCAKSEITKAYAELEEAQKERDMWKTGIEDCQKSILELESELNDMTAQWDMYGGDEGITAMIEERDKLRAKLEKMAQSCDEPNHMTYYKAFRTLPPEQLARLLLCPNQTVRRINRIPCTRGTPEHISCDQCIAAFLLMEVDPRDHAAQ